MSPSRHRTGRRSGGAVEIQVSDFYLIEQAVLLAILRLGSGAYGVPIRRDLTKFDRLSAEEPMQLTRSLVRMPILHISLVRQRSGRDASIVAV
jgi:hypothetical protein